MAETPAAEKTANSRRDQWRERIAEQQGSGLSVKAFCEGRDFSAHTLYAWRKRLRPAPPVRFALVERAATQPSGAGAPPIELLLPSGERLRIAKGVDAVTLRTVLAALRA